MRKVASHMVASEAKIAANRRNCLKSTGPTTQRGKDRSKMNATKHGCRAESLIIKDEDPAEFDARKEAWFASLSPQTDAEQRAVNDAVIYSWRQDRARRAEVALTDARRADYEAGGDTTVKQQVVELAERLFLDRLGPIELYPTGIVGRQTSFRQISTSFAGTGKPDPDDPAILVLRLQATLEGCEWMLGEWAKLKKTLDRGEAWLWSDKLRAVRLLGKQPIDALNDEDVSLVYLASFVLNPERSKWYWEISMELNDIDTRRFRDDAVTRRLEARLKPPDAAAARKVLQELVERATKPLESRAEAFRERDRVKAALAPDLLAFDPSVEAERLRRHELASGRGIARSLDTLLKLRNEDRRTRTEEPESALSDGRVPVEGGPFTLGQLSMVSGQLPESSCSDQDDSAKAPVEMPAPNEPMADSDVDISWALELDTDALDGVGRKRPNEATDGPSSVVSCQWSDDAMPRENATNEATDSSPAIATTSYSEGSFGSAAGATVDTNEPTHSQSSAVSGPLVEAGSRLQNVTNKATDTADGASGGAAGSKGGEVSAGQVSYMMSDGRVVTFDDVREFMHAQIADLQRKRAERLRKLNEESRELNQGPRATRRSRQRLNPTPVADAKRPSTRRKARAPSAATG